MNPFKKLAEILKANAYPTLESLEYLMAQKVEYIRFCFSNDITPQQLKAVKKDEALLKAIQAHVSTLNLQIDYLLGELEKTRLMASNSQKELIEVREENLKMIIMAHREKLKAFKYKNEQAA